jgi:hypothetical protein
VLQNLGSPRGAPQIPPLRYAPAGMTILLGNAKYSSQDELSSRPERTRISCHTALDKAARAPFRKEGRMKCTNATKFHRKSGERSGGICGAPLGLPKFWSSHEDSTALGIASLH